MPNNDLSSVNFFISSTYIDLKDYRDTVINKIKSKKGQIKSQEFFGSRPDSALDTMLSELMISDVVILILAYRYGSIDEKTGKSYTQIEYEKAKQENKIILAYIVNKSQPFIREHIDSGKNEKKLNKFKDLIRNTRSGLTVSEFTTKEDLAEKIIFDLFRELPKKEFTIGKELEEKLNKNYIKQLCEIPNYMEGKEILIRIELNEWQSTEQNACEALDLTYGSSIKRGFKAKDKEYANMLESKYNFIYANNEKAIELSELEDGEYLITLRIAFGYYTKNKKQSKEVKSSPLDFYGSTKIVEYDMQIKEPFQGLIFLGVSSV